MNKSPQDGEETISSDGQQFSGKDATSPQESAPSITEGPGSVLGPYKLQQQIGEGSFGVVFMAEQREPIKRQVALKIIKPGMDTKEVIARFEAERQALALMDHTNIAKVLDAGTTDTGRPYFAMELVKGLPITEYCDTHRLDTRQRLELFQDICAAVQHAHLKGIIHRDLKPSNILVALHDNKPVIKVIDFGVAKAISQELTELTLFTAHGQMIGTPHYMSPEQSEMSGLDIDTRSDIYSLGVVLYELLTGKTPLDPKKIRKAGLVEIHRMIREEEPSRPSTRLTSLSNEENTAITKAHNAAPDKLNRLMRGDLDWIVMKALEKDRGRRYETATGFAADIENYLTDQPVLASPPSASYRLGKFARRNKTTLTTVVLMFAVMLVGMLASIWQAARAEEQRKLAEQSAEDVKAVLDFFETKVLAAARPKDQVGGLGVDVTIREAIGAAEPQIGDTFADRPLVEESIRFTLGETFHYLGEWEAAIKQHDRALELRTKALGPEHPKTLLSMTGLATSYRSAYRNDEAMALRKKTLDLSKKALGPEHPDTLRAMANLSQSLLWSDNRDEAPPFIKKTLKLQQKVMGPEHPDTLQSMHNLALSMGTFTKDKLNEKTLALNEEALALMEKTLGLQKTALGPEHPDTIRSMQYLAEFYAVLGDEEKEFALKSEALNLKRKVLGPRHPGTLDLMVFLAIAYDRVDRHQEALPLHKERFESLREVWGPENIRTLRAMGILATAYGSVQRHEEEAALHADTLKLEQKVLGPEHPDALISMRLLAAAYVKIERQADAEIILEKVISLQEKHAPEGLSRAIKQLVSLYKDWDKPDKAAEWQAKLKALTETTAKPGTQKK